VNKGFRWRLSALAGAASLAIGCAPHAPDPGSRADDGDRLASSSDPKAAAEASRFPLPVPPTAAVPGAVSSAGNTREDLIALADVEPLGDSYVRGIVKFRGGDAGSLTLDVTLTGLEAGDHDLALLAGRDCASSAGAGLSSAAPLGPPQALGKVTANESGVAHEVVRDAVPGNDVIGRAVVVRRGAEAVPSESTGRAPSAIACGVIEANRSGQTHYKEGDRGV
jgi:Copper/zinc superoxide dismutase (SODC)